MSHDAGPCHFNGFRLSTQFVNSRSMILIGQRYASSVNPRIIGLGFRKFDPSLQHVYLMDEGLRKSRENYLPLRENERTKKLRFSVRACTSFTIVLRRKANDSITDKSDQWIDFHWLIENFLKRLLTSVILFWSPNSHQPCCCLHTNNV